MAVDEKVKWARRPMPRGTGDEWPEWDIQVTPRGRLCLAAEVPDVI